MRDTGRPSDQAGGLAVEVDSLVQRYRSRRGGETMALDGVSLEVRCGEVHGLLGPNGAGKTTLVKVLSTLLIPTGGRATVLGHDVVSEARAVRQVIGIVFGGDRGLYDRLTARQNLEYWGALYGLDRRAAAARSDELLDRMGLGEWADRPVQTFSRGMRQRAHLARGLVADPAVLFLDEPTLGMDPVAARELRTLVRGLQDEGRTVLLTTHDMDEAEALCDQVTLINEGAILATEPPRTLVKWNTAVSKIVAMDVPDEVVPLIKATDGVGGVHADGDRAEIEVDEHARSAVLDLLVRHGVTDLRTSSLDLEDIYLRCFGDRGLGVS